MPDDLSSVFQKRLDQAGQRLARLDEQQACEPFRPGGWTRKELLGHLLDSAANNQQRFVRAALEGHYEGASYDQLGWVRLNGYAELPWARLLESWRDCNATLTRIIRRIDPAQLSAMCRIGTNEPVTLEFLIEDYLRHLDHHVGQITGECND